MTYHNRNLVGTTVSNFRDSNLFALIGNDVHHILSISWGTRGGELLIEENGKPKHITMTADIIYSEGE